jgi:histidine ammonia-lyase
VPSLKEDRVVTKDIEKARQILMDGTLIRAVEEKTGPLE